MGDKNFQESSVIQFKEREGYETEQAMVKLLMDYIPSLTIIVLNFLIPVMLVLIVRLEKYNPTLELNMTLGRCVYISPYFNKPLGAGLTLFSMKIFVDYVPGF